MGSNHTSIFHRSNSPTVTLLLVSVTVVWFVYTFISYRTTTDPNVLYKTGALFGQLFDEQDWWRLLSPMFVHIGIKHLISNMILLLLIGSALEPIIGSIPFAMLYILTGFAGNLAVLYFNPNVVTAGASTALYGLFGYLLAKLFDPRSKVKQISRGYFILIVLNIIYTFLSPNVSLAGHMGGLVAGLAFGFVSVNFSHSKPMPTSTPDYHDYL